MAAGEPPEPPILDYFSCVGRCYKVRVQKLPHLISYYVGPVDEDEVAGFCRRQRDAEVDAAVAHIAGTALAFPEWGTRRAGWRDCDVRVSGDSDYGSRFLDEVNVV